MATIMHPREFLSLLHCTCPAHAPLSWTEAEVAVCGSCNKVIPVTDSVLELLDTSALDAETARELKGNTFALDAENIRWMASKDNWSTYYSHLQRGNFIPLSRYLGRVDCSRIISLGSGNGYEIKCLSKFRKFDTVICSDLSYTALFIARHTLESVDVKVGLFTSNLDDCPVEDRDVPLLIYEALHHTSDMHAALERFLVQGYRRIFLVEPANNFLIRALAKRGLAQRVEYSGVKPGRLDLRKLRSLCKDHGYQVSITTTWHFPVDYFEKICRSTGLLQSMFLLLLDAFSAVTSPFNFGNTAICFLKKNNDL